MPCGVSVQPKNDVDFDCQGTSIIPGGHFSSDNPEKIWTLRSCGFEFDRVVFLHREIKAAKLDEYMQDGPLTVNVFI